MRSIGPFCSNGFQSVVMMNIRDQRAVGSGHIKKLYKLSNTYIIIELNILKMRNIGPFCSNGFQSVVMMNIRDQRAVGSGHIEK